MPPSHEKQPENLKSSYPKGDAMKKIYAGDDLAVVVFERNDGYGRNEIELVIDALAEERDTLDAKLKANEFGSAGERADAINRRALADQLVIEMTAGPS
jgi:hypothetical protein